jgi:exonuclease VII small subunit
MTKRATPRALTSADVKDLERVARRLERVVTHLREVAESLEEASGDLEETMSYRSDA